MQTPSFKEDHISQIPALQVLQHLGYTYLSPDEVNKQRGGKTTNVILEEVLRAQLKEINSIRVSSVKTSLFSDANIEAGIQALKVPPMQEGYISANEWVYHQLTLGRSLEQSIDGDKKSFTLQYIDWEHLERNVFHVTEEYSVMRSGSKEHYVPDIVLFVNGIPLSIIECKRPDMKEPIRQAISQHLRNQQEDGIRKLYVYAQTVLSLATEHASYGTNATEEKFWARWVEKFESDEASQAFDQKLHQLRNTPLSPVQKDKLFGDRFRYVRQHFDALEQAEILPTEQDKYLLGLCEPGRLLELIFNYVLYDNHIKKVARYQQFFAVRKTAKRVIHLEQGKRPGGVIWHTQGSGKSLTMVMLAQAIALEKSIPNPKIILVTDRVDLDDQITKTFRKCGMFVENATTGKRLADLLSSKSDAVVTTIINKFEAAIRKMKPLDSHNIFVLVDEGHRTQHGTFNINMQKTLPNACFIALTGTPLFSKDKNTAARFGGIIDSYTVDQAVEDKAVVPLLYEGRHAIQKVNADPLDNYFSMVSEPLGEYERADLKKKFSRADQLNIADQKIYAICWDISQHFRDNWQDTPFKAQLVCQTKAAAVKYKQYLDECKIVNSEVLISPPDDREGEDSAYSESSDKVKAFWKAKMDEFGGSPKKYEKNLISRFKNDSDLELIIVVDKLLTGFDEPKNTVLYLTRNLRGHKLLQAIARVNRISPDKEYGYVIDYYGVIEELDNALQLYSSFEEFDEDDLAGTLTNITEVIAELPQKHAEVWDLFKEIRNKRDAKAYLEVLRDDAIRAIFYDKLAAFAKAFKLAMSSMDFHRSVDEKLIKRYKEDLTLFLSLRVDAAQLYSDKVDYKQYEGQIQKLIDTHIETDRVVTMTELVNIFDKEKFQKEIEKTVGTAAKADKIASRTSKHISEHMDEDPAFYKKFSEMLKQTIKDYLERRITEVQYLERTTELMDKVLSRTDASIPDVLQQKPVAQAFYGLSLTLIATKLQDNGVASNIAAEAAIEIDKVITEAVLDQGTPVVDWPHKSHITGKLQIDIGDYLIDEVRDKYQLDLSFGEMDRLADECMEVAKLRYKG
ncbi:MAG: HsdR family type I site-specific deoxyribonuclease [Roseivirga sp.]